MRVPLEWLREFVAVRLRPAVLAERLTMAGVEVIGVETLTGQPVLDLELTPNRADCLSILGVAREVAALTGARLKTPTVRSSKFEVRRKLRTLNFPLRTAFAIRIEDRRGCVRYIGRLIEGVTVAPSPAWMQRRLIACGTRPINNIVDITNYVLLESGQPLHAFDYHRVAEGVIRVRRARDGESITTLDDTARILSPDMLVIADAHDAIAVAGVMGGLGSEVTEQTRSVLLESALFDPITVRRTARTLGLVSESSYRFERGVDPEGTERASARAAQLIVELAGGTVQALKDVGRKPSASPTITLDATRLNRWLGTSLPPADIRSTLARASCRVAASGDGPTMRVSAPLFRRDLTQPVDLYEEVARLVGYDRIQAATPLVPMAGERSEAMADYGRRQSLRSLCAGLGLTEVVNWSLVSAVDLSRCRADIERAVRLANPLSQDHAYLRPSLVIGLLHTIRRNVTQGMSSVRIFEVGNVMEREGAVRSSPRLGIALSGSWAHDWRMSESCDFFRLKGLVETLTHRMGGAATTMERGAVAWAEPSGATAIVLNGRPLGVAGQVARAVTEPLDIAQDVWVAELSVEALLACRRPSGPVRTPAVFPPVKRDLSVQVGDGTAFAALLHTIREVGGVLASRVELIDRYTGSQVPSGHHSLTFSIEYRDPSRTLTAAEVDALHQRIGQALRQRHGAELR